MFQAVLLGRADSGPIAVPSSAADAEAAFVYSFGRGVGYSYANQIQFGTRGGGNRFGGQSGGYVQQLAVQVRPQQLIPTVQSVPTALSQPTTVSQNVPITPIEQEILIQTAVTKDSQDSPAANLLPIAEYGDFGDTKLSFRSSSPRQEEEERPFRLKTTEQLLSKAVGDRLLVVKQVQSFDVVPAVPGLPVLPLPQ